MRRRGLGGGARRRRERYACSRNSAHACLAPSYSRPVLFFPNPWPSRPLSRTPAHTCSLLRVLRFTQTSLYTVKSVLVLDTEGKRILAKYYGNDFATVKEQLAFEKNLFEKTKRYPGTRRRAARSQ